MNGTSQFDGASEGPSLLAIALGAKLRLLLTGLIAAVLAYGALTQVPSTYEAVSQVVLDGAAPAVIDIPNAVAEAPDGVATLESAIVIMRSRGVMRDVVTELNLTELPEFNSALRDPSLGDRARDLLGWIVTHIKQLAGMSTEVAEGTPRDPVSRTAGALRNAVDVTGIGESRVIEITTTSEDPALAAAISNAVAQQYLERQVAAKREAGERASDWLDERVAELRTQLDDQEARLADFRREVLASGREVSTDLEAQLAELTAQQVQLTKQRSDLSAQSAEVTQLRDGGNFITLSSAVNVPTLTSLVEQLAQIDSNILSLQSEFGDHPKTREAQALRQQVLSLLNEEAGRLVAGLEVRIGVLDDRLAALQTQIRDTRSVLVESQQDDLKRAALERDLEASRSVYDRFLLRQKEVRERSQFQSSGARLVSEAERPALPVAPQKAKLSVLAAIGAMVAMLLYLAFLKPRNAAKSKPEDLWKLPELGNLLAVPQMPALKRPADILRYIQDKPDADLGVSLRWLQLYTLPKSADWTTLIVVTSPEGGEGKSTLSLLLAETFSRDFSTILVNAAPGGWLSDFGKMKAADRAGFKLLEGSDALLDLIEEEVGIEDNQRDRSAALLGADVIIVNAPAMPMPARMLEISQIADHFILTCAWNKSRLKRVHQCVEALREVGIEVSTFVLNMVPKRSLASDRAIPRNAPPLSLAPAKKR